MLEDLIKEIRDTEAQAETVHKNALEKGKEMVAEAEKKAGKLLSDSALKLKQERSAALQEANKTADLKAAEMLKAGVEEAENLLNEKNNEILEKADEVVRELLKRYIPEEDEEE